MLYTIAEVSKLIGLSKVSIYKKLKVKELEVHLSKKQGITYITEEGLTLIKDTLKVNEEVKTELKPKDIISSDNQEIAIDTESFDIKYDYINTLKQQLNEKDSQIKELTLALGKAQGLHQNTQVLLRHEQEQPVLLEQHIKELDDKFIMVKDNMQQRAQHEVKEKKNWFNKILRK